MTKHVNLLKKKFNPAGVQWVAGGKTHKLEALSREDLLQVSCECIEALERMDVLQGSLSELMRAWRDGCLEPVSECDVALSASHVGPVDELAGWFDVNAYATRERWEGPDLAESVIDGLNTLEAALECANDLEFLDYYQVEVVAYGVHADYEPGERVYLRFSREDCEVKVQPVEAVIE